MGSDNPYYAKIDPYVSSGTFWTVNSLNRSTATLVATAPAGTMMLAVGQKNELPNVPTSSVPSTRTVLYVKYDPSDPAMVAAARNTYVAAAYNTDGTLKTATVQGAGPASNYSAGDITGKFICQKCHKLVNPYQGITSAANNSRNNNLNYIGYSNEVHMEHHGNVITGAANCISCHIAIPHGWVRPRLLVYASDPAPYMQAQAGAATTQTVVANGVTYNNVVTWAGTTSTDPRATHLYGIDAAATAVKEGDDAGNAVIWAPNDAASGSNFSNWNTRIGGIGWLGDTGISSSSTTFTAGTAVQNNCNACNTGTGTHSPASTEGIPNGYPTWK